MSKAVLVMDMPSNCKECNMSVLARESHTGQMCFRCVNHPTIMVLTKEKTRPDWCPLKPMPEKKSTEYNPARNPYITEGYNACIDEILGD